MREAIEICIAELLESRGGRERLFDVVVVGSGFGGTLLATILAKLGYRVAVIDRGRHPRFAIGESSTPIADAILEDLARSYELDELLALTRYGTCRRHHPTMGVGCKRGFSYFGHQPNQEFNSDESNANQLLVAASVSDEVSDTHWYRQDFDQFFFDLAQKYGVDLMEGFCLHSISQGQAWEVAGTDENDQPTDLTARYLIDASGAAAVVTQHLSIPRFSDSLQTHSQAVYGHFTDVRRWESVLQELEVNTQSHPYHCDDAALHHVLPEGWMWQLRFDNGITSVGFVLDGHDRSNSNDSNSIPKPIDNDESRANWWNRMTEQYPSIQRQMSDAIVLTPGRPLRVTERMQFLVEQASGPGWACLPSAAGFVDPLHSSGIAHTLSGIERLSACFEQMKSNVDVRQEWLAYGQAVRQELICIDKLIACCYLARADFRAWCAACMLYFAAATTYEHRRHESGFNQLTARFLCAGDMDWQASLDKARVAILAWRENQSEHRSVESLEAEIRQLIEPMNRVGLLNPDVNQMYARTVAPGKG